MSTRDRLVMSGSRKRKQESGRLFRLPRLRSPTPPEHHLVMQEVLSKTVDPEAPLRGQEFYELSLLDEANDLGRGGHFRTASLRFKQFNVRHER